MAEQNVQQDVNQQETKEERTPFKIELENPIPFTPIAETEYLTSNDLCQLTNELFKSVFADCEGSIFEPGNGMPPFISLVFNHGNYDNGTRVACERMAGSKGNDVVSRVRYRDNYVANGDRYFLTDDGKDVFKELLNPRAYNNGNPKWKTIVAEHQEMQPMYGQQPQYTKVMFLDPARICEKIFGDELDGDKIAYNVNIIASMNRTPMPNVASNNFLLQVTRVSAKEIKGVYEKLGFGSFSSIVR